MSVVRGLYLTVLIATAVFRLAVVVDNTLRIWREKKRNDPIIEEQNSGGDEHPSNGKSLGPERDTKGRFLRGEQHGREGIISVRNDERPD